MAETIKLLQFWYMAEVPTSGGETMMVEKIAHRGDEVEIVDEYDLQRGEEQDAFMSDEEKQAFADERGPYDVATAEEIKAATPPPSEGEFDWEEATPDDMADHMEETNMTVNQVLEVAHAHPDKLDDILEAENIVTGDSPRKGVTEGIAKIAADSTE